MKKLLKEPLVHFLLAGLGLFLVYRAVAGPEAGDDDPKTVVVDREALLTFIQYRSKAFERGYFEQKLDGMPADELDRLVDDYVREEVLHREALALGLEEDDYVIRRRLVQKVEFVTEGFAEAATEVDETALERYFEEHKGDYYVEPYVTFTHVFFDKEKHGMERGRELAEKKLNELHKKQASFSDAPGHGDRFLYHVNYVERTPEFVASHFGVPMAKAIFELEPSDIIWRGPYESAYGMHVVMLTKMEPGRDAVLSEIRGRVEQDAQQAMIRERKEQAINGIIDSYDVQITYRADDPELATR